MWQNIPQAANDNIENKFIFQINDSVNFFWDRKENTWYYEIEIDGKKHIFPIEFSFNPESERYSMKFNRTTISIDEYGLYDALRDLYQNEFLTKTEYELLALIEITWAQVAEALS